MDCVAAILLPLAIQHPAGSDGERWRDEWAGGGGGVIRGESRATAPSKDTTIPRGYLLSSEFLSLFSCWT